MKKALYILALMCFLTGCVRPLYPEYTLIKKYPQGIPDLDLQILNDTIGVIIRRGDKSIKQSFRFIKKDRNFLIITYIEDTGYLIPLKEGDTVVYYKKELYLISQKYKLVFTKKE